MIDFDKMMHLRQKSMTASVGKEETTGFSEANGWTRSRRLDHPRRVVSMAKNPAGSKMGKRRNLTLKSIQSPAESIESMEPHSQEDNADYNVVLRRRDFTIDNDHPDGTIQ